MVLHIASSFLKTVFTPNKTAYLHTYIHSTDVIHTYIHTYIHINTFFPVALWPNAGHGLSFLMFLEHTKRRTTVGRTPLDEWSARRRDLYLTTHNTHNRHTSMAPVGFEPTIPAGERPQTYALDRAATGTGIHINTHALQFTQPGKHPPLHPLIIFLLFYSRPKPLIPT